MGKFLYMWKEELPSECPPDSAKEMNADVFRFLDAEDPSKEDFLPYCKLYPGNSRYQTLCEAHAISFYDSFSNAQRAFESSKERGRLLGAYIGRFRLEEKHGRNEHKMKTGHINTWLYLEWDLSSFELLSVSELK